MLYCCWAALRQLQPVQAAAGLNMRAIMCIKSCSTAAVQLAHACTASLARAAALTATAAVPQTQECKHEAWPRSPGTLQPLHRPPAPQGTSVSPMSLCPQTPHELLGNCPAMLCCAGFVTTLCVSLVMCHDSDYPLRALLRVTSKLHPLHARL